MDPSYVTANIVAYNNNPQQVNLNISDIFDIPDITSVPAAPSVPLVPSVPSVPALTSANVAKAMNHIAMTDLMNHVARNASKTPSVSTKISDVSVHIPAAPILIKPLGTLSPLSIPVQSMNETTKKPCNKPIQGHRMTMTAMSKVIIEDDDKDTAVDYDEDDPEIKKIKLSLFHFAKDITFNLIFTIPFLRTKLNSILKEPNLAINQIERVFDEFKDLLNRQQLESIKKYVCEEGVRDKLNYILETGFNKILADGKIDINDAPQFNQLVYFIIKSFNNINQGKVYRFYVSRDHVMILLHFILKSVFILTLKGEEEQMAIGLLDTSFKLVQLEVLPLISKRWYHKFRVCHSVKEIEELIE